MKKILAADIGGTNSRFAHFSADHEGNLSRIETLWLKTEEYESFGALINHVKSSGFSLLPERSDISVIAVAGPVERGVYSSPPFISWDIDISDAKKDFGLNRCILINDFVAQAYACRSPIGETAAIILSGNIVHDAAAAVIGAGTALGKAALVPDGKGRYIAVPSEGGHASFPFVSRSEYEFQEYLIEQLGEEYVTANKVVSGRGISYIHYFLTGEKLEPKEVTAAISLHVETLAWAARFYGRVCRNYALEVLACGGVYVAGGVAAKTPELLRHDAFAEEFRSSRTMSDILKGIPVFLITDEESGLWGAALLGIQMLP